MPKKDGCSRQTLKKYVERKSPPFPANECCGQKMTGNDGATYVSVPNKNGVCRWVLDKPTKAPKAPSSPRLDRAEIHRLKLTPAVLKMAKGDVEVPKHDGDETREGWARYERLVRCATATAAQKVLDHLTEQARPDWKRGDYVVVDAINGRTGAGVYVYDGKRVIELDRNFDDGTPPFPVSREFHAQYWNREDDARLLVGRYVMTAFGRDPTLKRKIDAWYKAAKSDHVTFDYEEQRWAIVSRVDEGDRMGMTLLHSGDGYDEMIAPRRDEAASFADKLGVAPERVLFVGPY